MLLTKEKLNTGRQIEIDLLKAFTVVFSMIIIHVYDYDTNGFENKFTWFIDTVSGGILAAPIFMFCMGIGMEYSRNKDPKQMMLRGLRLLTIGQVLNFFRYETVLWIKSIIDTAYDYLPGQILNFSSDIMQLAGLGFILMGVLCKLKLKNWAVLLIAMALSICGTLLEHVQTGFYFFDQFLGLFWGTDTESFFPLFNWFIFIAAGKCFGVFYQHLSNKSLFYLIFAPIGILCLATTWHLQLHTDCTFFNSFDPEYFGFSWMRLQDSLSVILIAPFLLSIFYLLSKVLPEKTTKVMSHPSKHINQYYCVSWWWIMVVNLFAFAENTGALISTWLNILALTIISVVFYNSHLKDRVEAFCSKHRTLLTTLIWVITLGMAYYSYLHCTNFPTEFNDYLMK